MAESSGNLSMRNSVFRPMYLWSQVLSASWRLCERCTVAQLVKNLPALQETPGEGIGCSLQYSFSEEPGGPQSMGSQRVGRNWVTKHSTAQHNWYFDVWMSWILCFLNVKPSLFLYCDYMHQNFNLRSFLLLLSNLIFELKDMIQIILRNYNRQNENPWLIYEWKSGKA